MRVDWKDKDGGLCVYFEGELDHHAAKKAIHTLNSLVDELLPLRCELDMGGVSFMDSSGIAVVLGLYRRIYEIGGEIVVINVPSQALKVLTAAGIDKIVPLAKQLSTVQ